jgi:large subunit ribosomal protein L17
MRHLNAGRKFGRNTSHRRAMFKNLAANLIAHEQIETTDQKAKELRRIAERLITKAIRLGTVAYSPASELGAADRARRLHAQRVVATSLPRFGTRVVDGAPKKIDLIEKVFCELAKRFHGRPGGYTRIVKLGPRRGDNAAMSIIEFVKDAPKTAEKAPAADETPKATAKKPRSSSKKATAAEPTKGAKAQ